MTPIAAIIAAVADDYNLPVPLLLSTERTPGVAEARRLAMYLARQITQRQIEAVARAFARDHATVDHAMDTIRAALRTSAVLSLRVERIKGRLG